MISGSEFGPLEKQTISVLFCVLCALLLPSTRLSLKENSILLMIITDVADVALKIYLQILYNSSQIKSLLLIILEH